jgi:hypothetical protein
VEFGSVLTPHQRRDGAPRFLALVEDPKYRLADRHLDAERVAEHAHVARRGDAFGDVSELAQDGRQRLPTRQGQPDAAVARQIARAGQNQVAQPRQAHERFALSAEGRGQAPSLGQSARDQRRARVVAEAQAIARAGGDCQHVFHCASDLDPDQVVADIGAEGLAAQALGHRLGQTRVGRRHRDRGRQPAGDLGGEARTGDHAHRRGPVRAEHLVRQGNAGRLRGGDKSLAQPEQRRRDQASRRGGDFEQRADRRGDEDERGSGEHLGQRGAHGNRRRQREAGKVAQVFACAAERLRLGRVARPEADGRRRPRPGEMDRERSTPRARAQDGDGIHHGVRPAARGYRPQTCWMRTKPT